MERMLGLKEERGESEEGSGSSISKSTSVTPVWITWCSTWKEKTTILTTDNFNLKH
jgi:hypothetical protein